MATLVVLGAILLVAYLVSLRLHPMRRCRPCKGTGRHFGAVFKSSHRGCTSCGGNGRRARLGVNLLHRGGLVWGERAPARASAERERNFGR